MIGALEMGIDMKFRTLLFAILFSLTSSPAFACSCAPWEGGYVSDYANKYLSLWGVPLSAAVDLSSNSPFGELVIYEVDVLEGYGRLSRSLIHIQAIAPDGGNCGTSLNIGITQFISASEDRQGNLEIGGCTPELPYKAIKGFLESEDDIYIPSPDTCFIKGGEIDEQNPDCMIWKDDSNFWQSPEERNDRRKYESKWNRDK